MRILIFAPPMANSKVDSSVHARYATGYLRAGKKQAQNRVIEKKKKIYESWNNSASYTFAKHLHKDENAISNLRLVLEANENIVVFLSRKEGESELPSSCLHTVKTLLKNASFYEG